MPSIEPSFVFSAAFSTLRQTTHLEGEGGEKGENERDSLEERDYLNQ